MSKKYSERFNIGGKTQNEPQAAQKMAEAQSDF